VHDSADAGARLGDQRLDRRAANREEADQVLGRRQRRDIDDALVVGLARLLGRSVEGSLKLGRRRKKTAG
jgi:hypothetical protein